MDSNRLDRISLVFIPVMKLIVICFITGYVVISTTSGSYFGKDFYAVIALCGLLASSLLINTGKRFAPIALVICAGIVWYLTLQVNSLFMLCAVPLIFDAASIAKIHTVWGFVSILLVFVSNDSSLAFLYTGTVGFVGAIYYLNFEVVYQYVQQLDKASRQEENVQGHLQDIQLRFQSDVSQLNLRYENEYLAQTSELMQQLHDKLGHSMSGSIFKLEAAKLLFDQDPTKSKEMLEDVITLQRESIDEIRMLLRQKKPNSSTLHNGKIKLLFSDFSGKYNLPVSYQAEGNVKLVSSELWIVLAENSLELLTNAMRYSNCTRITVTLNIFEKFLRFTVTDNGEGTSTLVKGLGLQGIENRVSDHGGTVTFAHNAQFQTTIVLPLDDEGLMKRDVE